MADIFVSKEARKVLKGKHIAIIGGSNMRGLYKDIVWLLNDDSFIPKEVLGEKLEKRFPDFESQRCARANISNRLKKKFNDDNRDWLFKNEGLHPGRTYVEPRIYYHEKKDITINFRFVTRVWSSKKTAGKNSLEEFLRTYETIQEAKLDLIIMNSLLWDVNRWGPDGISEYKKNLPTLLKTIKEVMAENGQFIWLTAQPGSKQLDSKAMETPGLEFQKKTTRYNVVEANFFTAHKVAEAGFDVIDLHYYFLLQTFRRNRDGIHWSPEANRYVTNMVLTHVCLADHKTLPKRNVQDFALERVIFMADVAKGQVTEKYVEEKLENLQNIADTMIVKGSAKEDSQLPPLHELQRNAREIVPDGMNTGPPGPMRMVKVIHDRPGPYDRHMQQDRHRFGGPGPRAPHQRRGGNGPRFPPRHQGHPNAMYQTNEPNHMPMHRMNEMYGYNQGPNGDYGEPFNREPQHNVWNDPPFNPRPPNFNPNQMPLGNRPMMNQAPFQNFDMQNINLNNQLNQFNHQDYQDYQYYR